MLCYWFFLLFLFFLLLNTFQFSFSKLAAWFWFIYVLARQKKKEKKKEHWHEVNVLFIKIGLTVRERFYSKLQLHILWSLAIWWILAKSLRLNQQSDCVHLRTKVILNTSYYRGCKLFLLKENSLSLLKLCMHHGVWVA